MSNPLKKAVKGVKKVFKKVVQTVKKVVASKLFKVVLIAAAVYFTAGAAAGYLGAAGATGGAAAGATGSAAISAGAGAMSATAPVVGAGVVGGAATAVAAPSAIGSIVAGATGAAGSMTVGQGLLASAVLQTGGNMLGAYAQGEKEKDLIKTLDKNGSHNVDVTGIYQNSMDKAGMVRTDEQGRTVYGQPNAPTPPAIQQVANVDPRKPSYYNSATDSWSPVQRISNAAVADNKAEVNA